MKWRIILLNLDLGPKVEAACEFVNKTGERAVIGSLSELEKMISGDAGTQFVIR